MCVKRAISKTVFIAIIAIGAAVNFDVYHEAYAQQKQISGTEKAIIAYYRLSNQTPDFEEWIYAEQNNKPNAKKLDADTFHQEKLRLQYGFGTYEPEEALLRINTRVFSQIITSNGKTYLATHFPHEKAMAAPYFPYKAGNTEVAVIINKLKDYLLLELSDQTLERAKVILPDEKAYELNMTIYYRPSDAQANPIKIDGRVQHLMLGEIAYFNINRSVIEGIDGKAVIWEYYAPWYLNDGEQELLDILNAE